MQEYKIKGPEIAQKQCISFLHSAYSFMLEEKIIRKLFMQFYKQNNNLQRNLEQISLQSKYQ